MFKKIKQGKMLEINERKKNDCGACGGFNLGDVMSERHTEGYLEMLEKW